MNIVYRGVVNPIKISVPNAVKFEATAPGLKKIDEIGNYSMYPLTGKTVNINIESVMINGDTINSIKTLRINNIEKLIGTINGKSGILELKKKQIINGKIEVKINDFLFPWEFNVIRFKIKLANNAFIQIEGQTIPTELNDDLNNLEVNDVIHIFDIATKLKNGPSSLRYKRPSPIKIIVKD